jgi:hypothetical protein
MNLMLLTSLPTLSTTSTLTPESPDVFSSANVSFPADVKSFKVWQPYSTKVPTAQIAIMVFLMCDIPRFF